ncbi:MAG: MFS transporter [Planctomycetaceae bacterium]|jgi:MFS family permease|nr:MFS transporter [Planctomycetaceae bacterium]
MPKKFFSRSKTRNCYRFALALFYFSQGIVFASWASRIPDIRDALGMNEAMLGSLLFCLPAGQLLTMAITGWAVERFGSRAMVATATLFYPLALVLISLSTSVTQLALSMLSLGITANMANIAINTQAIGIQNLYHRRSIMATFHGIWSMAGLSGGLVGSLFVTLQISPFIHFCVIYVLTLLINLTMRTSLLPRDIKRFTKNNEQVADQQDGQKTVAVKDNHRFSFLIDRYLLILGFIAFGSMTCEGTMFDWSGVYYEDIVQPPKYLARLGYVASMFTMMSGRFIADYMITRFGVINILKCSGITITTGLLTATIFPYITTATIGFMLIGFGVSAVVPIVYSLSGRSKKLNSGTALAIVSTVGMLGFLIGPPIIGFIAYVLNLRWSLGIISLMGIFITIFATVISKEIE